MAKTKTTTGQLNDSLKGLQKYIKSPGYDFQTAANYITQLAAWANMQEVLNADSTNPAPPPPPPPGHA